MSTELQRTWTLEFLLRQPTTDGNHMKRLLPLLQPSIPAPCLTKTLLLRRLSSDVRGDLISGRTLETLELIERIDSTDGHPVLDSLKDAYCAVAFHCTVNLFKHNSEENGRIWRDRVLGMLRGKGVTLDSYLCKGDFGGDTRVAAVELVKVFLEEAIAQMGPSFLEMAAKALVKKAGKGCVTMEDDEMEDQVGVPKRSSADIGEIGGACPAEESDVRAKKGRIVLTPEFREVRDALKSSMVELHDAVRDPLPDALLMAADISRNIEKDGVNDAPSTSNQNNEGVNNVPSTLSQNEVDADAFVDKECQVVLVHAKEGNNRNSRPSLMERNSTAQTLEWDDESPSPCPHLPTPSSINVSPLNRQMVRNNAGKRRKKMWTSLEEQTLIDAVREYGLGNWTRILDEYREIFDERIPGDLKDKWRNLTK